MVPSKKVLTELSMNGNKLKNVGLPVDSTDGVNKAYVDNLTDTFVKTFTESFANDDYIATSSNMVLENGYIRANRQYQVDQNVFSDANGTKSGSIAYNTNSLTISSSTDAEGIYTTNWHTGLTSSSSINLASNFTHDFANTVGNGGEVNPPSGSLQTDTINYKQVVDISNRVWHFYQVRSTGTLYGWVTDINNGNIVAHSLLSTGVAAIATSPAVPPYRTLNAVTSDDGHVYVTFWTGGNSTTARIRTLKLRVNAGSLEYGTTTNGWQGTTVAFEEYNPASSAITCIDSFYDNVGDRLYILFQANNSTKGASLRVISGLSYSFISEGLVLGDSGAKQVCIAYNPTNGARELGLFLFDDATSSAVKARRFSLQTGAFSSSLISFAFACNGVGGATFDEVNDRYFIVFLRNDDVVTTFQSTMDRASVTKSFSSASNITTLQSDNQPTSSSTYKDSSFYFENGSFYFIYHQFVNGFNETIYRYTSLYRFNTSTGSVVFNFNSLSGSIVGTNNSSFVKKNSELFATWTQFSDLSGTFSDPMTRLIGQDSTKLKIEVRNQTSPFITVYNNNSSWGDLVNDLSDEDLNTPKTISLGTTDTQIQVRFTLKTPNASNLVPFVNSYKIFVNESNTNSVTATFVSESLIDDRLITKATLSADTTTVGLSGTITWRMSNNGGTTWDTATPGTELVFSNGAGNNLKVEGNIAIGSEIANANSVRINSYTVTTTNVVLQSDLYNLQINLAKMGLQITTLSTANRLGYKNMMIDVFASSTGVEPYSIDFMYNGQSFLNFSGAELILTSVQEDTDITNVSSIVVIGDPLDIGQGVTYQVRRGEGVTASEWATVTPEQIHTFSSGTPTNKVQIRAIVPNGSAVRGWAYLYA